MNIERNTRFSESPSVGSFADLEFSTEYRKGQEDLVKEFYIPCLSRAYAYDRAVGYFRSSALLMIKAEILEFAKRNGRMRLVCGVEVTKEDLAALEEGHERRKDRLARLAEQELDQMLSMEENWDQTKILSTLVALEVIDVRIAVLPSSYGEFHDKLGMFRDSEGNMVTFKGSANETWRGWHEKGNHESFDVFCSWMDERDKTRTQKHEESFELLWNGKANQVNVYPIPEAAKNRLISFASNSLEQLERELERDKSDQPSIRRTPRAHQIAALKGWKEADCKGLFEHATGSGKTFTALIAIKEHVDQGKPAIVLVPSQLLLKQWEEEVAYEIPKANLLLVGGGNIEWRKKSLVRHFTAPDSELGARIIIGTMQTCRKTDFRKQIQGGEHLLVVMDEVHQVGSTENSDSLTIDAAKRLGLSATPRRYGDPAGTDKIFDYFGGVIEPPFTLRDAIDSECLVPYQYYPKDIYLTLDESEDWARLSRKLREEIARATPSGAKKPIFSEKAKLLTIRRSRIAKKATNKIGLASDILQEHYQKGERWLIYCEDQDQLREVKQLVQALDFDVNEYHTAMTGSKEETLDWFKTIGGILVAIGCLDEGVDIPQVSHALILASSQNPRQFIQRRGRVLRRSAGKHLANIFDVLVVPPHVDDAPDQAPLLEAELTRAIEFGDMAINKSASAELRSIAIKAGLDPIKLSYYGEESDNSDDEE
jgi:superfamily II DNA or RNA helicase